MRFTLKELIVFVTFVALLISVSLSSFHLGRASLEKKSSLSVEAKTMDAIARDPGRAMKRNLSSRSKILRDSNSQ